MRRTMPPTQLPLTRRLALSGLGLAALPARAEALPELLIAGPPGGRLDLWAEVLAGPIGLGLPTRTPLTRRNVGGLDGVTGANQFEARSELDGSAAMLVPGAAALSWLVGESRVKFDPSRWVPLWAGVGSAALLSRVALVPGHRVKVAANSPAGPELAALLTLDLMGVDVVLAPLAQADAVFVQGGAVAPLLASARAQGFAPMFTLGLPDGEGGRDPALPEIPTAHELAQPRAPSTMLAALRAASLAVQLDAGLVLPQLTPAASIALWRRACAPLLQDAAVLSEAARLGARLVIAADAAACTSRLADRPGTLLALREWLATRYTWRAG